MSDAEVMNIAIVAVLYLGGNFEKARKYRSEPQYIRKMLSQSRFNRIFYRVESLLLMLFDWLGQAWKQVNTESIYSIDSFPIPICDNIHIPSSKIYDGNEEYRGYQASKKRYFYGIKNHLMVTE